MKNKHIILTSIGIFIASITIPSIASTYENFSLTSGQIEFIKLFDKQNGTKFSSLINTPNANRIISAATFACGQIDFQKKLVIAAGGDNKTSIEASKTFESLFCDHTVIKGH